MLEPIINQKMPEDNQKRCRICGRIKPIGSYIKTRSWVYTDGYSDICGECFDRHFKEVDWNWQEVDKTCQTLDIPFIPRVLEEMKEKKVQNTFLMYSKYFAGVEYEPFHWQDYFEKWKELKMKGDIDKELPLIKDDYYSDLALRWGKNYDREELVYLENLYNGILSSQNVAGALNHDQAQKLCKLSLQIDEFIRAGEPVDKLMSSYEKLTKVANFTPQNAKADNDFSSFGEVAAWLEKRKWINKWYDDADKDIVDEVIHSMQNFVRRLYIDESGIGDEITNRIEQLKVAKELEEGDSKLDKIRVADYFEIEEVDLDKRENEAYEEFKIDDDSTNWR